MLRKLENNLQALSNPDEANKSQKLCKLFQSIPPKIQKMLKKSYKVIIQNEFN